MKERLCWIENSLKNYASNFHNFKTFIGPTVKIMAVVKANAYGHGIDGISTKAQKLGADFFGVVCVKEAKQLRENKITKPILILNYTDPDSCQTAVGLDLRFNVMDESVLKTLNSYAEKKRKKVFIHVKIDTGMHRLGLLPSEALSFIPKIENYKNINLEGIFTHFSSADEVSLDFTHEQLRTFESFLRKLKGHHIHPPIIHAANSAATLRMKTSHFSMVRPGIALYGCPPSPDFKLPFPLRPVLSSFKTLITQIRRIHRGETVGYGRTFTAKNETVVAALAVGYADGFRRAPNNWGDVLVLGKRAKVLGRVSMDQTSIDITHIPTVSVGDEVVLIGKQGNDQITVEEVAQRLGTINYEVLSSIAERVGRVFID